MTMISNIWLHPKTTVAGILIAAVTIAGVLSQQGITLGTAGTGTSIALIGALATAMLGLLAKDPQAAALPTSSAKLGVIMLCAILIAGTFPLAGCSGQQVAQDIVNWTPALQSAVTVIDNTGPLLDPAAAPIFTLATTTFDAASSLLASQAQAYLNNPSATLLGQLQNQVATFQQQVNTALLQAARIVDTKSQAQALAAINGVAVIVSAIFALVASISSKTALASMAARATVKISTVVPYLDNRRAIDVVSTHYNEPPFLARVQLANARTAAMQAGF